MLTCIKSLGYKEKEGGNRNSWWWGEVQENPQKCYFCGRLPLHSKSQSTPPVRSGTRAFLIHGTAVRSTGRNQIFFNFFWKKKWRENPKIKLRVGCSRVLLEGPIGNWGRKKGSLQRILTWSGAGPRGEAKRLGFLCSCAPTCLVTWRRSLGLGSPPPKWGRRESEPRSEWRKPRHPQDRRLKTEQRRVC